MPSVADPDRPLERRPGVSADPDRDVPGGLGLGTDVLEAARIDGELGGDVIVGPHPDHLDGFVGASSPLVEGHAEGVELGLEPSTAAPRITRPPLSWSMVAIDWRTTTGLRIGRTSTVVPMRQREGVAAATQVITANGSRTYADGGFRDTGRHDEVVADPHVGEAEVLGQSGGPGQGSTRCGRTGLRQVDAAVIDAAAVIVAPYRDPGARCQVGRPAV